MSGQFLLIKSYFHDGRVCHFLLTAPMTISFGGLAPCICRVSKFTNAYAITIHSWNLVFPLKLSILLLVCPHYRVDSPVSSDPEYNPDIIEIGTDSDDVDYTQEPKAVKRSIGELFTTVKSRKKETTSAVTTTPKGKTPKVRID